MDMLCSEVMLSLPMFVFCRTVFHNSCRNSLFTGSGWEHNVHTFTYRLTEHEAIHFTLSKSTERSRLLVLNQMCSDEFESQHSQTGRSFVSCEAKHVNLHGAMSIYSGSMLCSSSSLGEANPLL